MNIIFSGMAVFFAAIFLSVVGAVYAYPLLIGIVIAREYWTQATFVMVVVMGFGVMVAG